MREYSILSQNHKDEVVGAVEEAVRNGGLQTCGHAYAYKHGEDDDSPVSWGVNAGPHGWCVARGVLSGDEAGRFYMHLVHLTDHLISEAEYRKRVEDILGR